MQKRISIEIKLSNKSNRQERLSACNLIINKSTQKYKRLFALSSSSSFFFFYIPRSPVKRKKVLEIVISIDWIYTRIRANKME